MIFQKNPKACRSIIVFLLLLTAPGLRAQQPDWQINSSDFVNRMNMVGFLWIDREESADTGDMVAAFSGNELVGVAQPVFLTSINRHAIFLTLYSNSTSGTISFKAYDRSADAVVELLNTVEFVPDQLVGGLESSFVWSNVALGSGAELVSFSLPAVQTGSPVFNGQQVRLEVSLAAGEQLDAQLATFQASQGAQVTVAGVVQQSGSTSNDFSVPVTYRVQSEDLLTINTYVVEVVVVNQAPVDINLSNQLIAENQDETVLVGEISTSDLDPGDQHSYELVAGVGSDDNAAFEIIDQNLVTRVSFNYEESATRSIRLRSTDAFGEVFEKAITIQVQDLNEVPELRVPLEDQQTTDRETLTYALDPATFYDEDLDEQLQITARLKNGSDLPAWMAFDAATMTFVFTPDQSVLGTETIVVTATDKAGEQVADEFAISVSLFNNRRPTGISLSNESVNENLPAGSLVAVLTTVDPDLVDRHEYRLISNNGNDSRDFRIEGDRLLTNAPFNFEESPSRRIRIRSTDAGGSRVTRNFVLSVNDLNEVPELLIPLEDQEMFGHKTLTYALPQGTFLDQDADDELTYQVVQVGGAALPSWASFNAQSLTFTFNPQDQFFGVLDIVVTVADEAGLEAMDDFSLTVTEFVNNPPTAVNLSSSSLPENSGADYVIAQLSTDDVDVDDEHLYELVTGAGDADNSQFYVNGAQLFARVSFDHEQQATYSIRLRTTDLGEEFIEQAFDISVLDVNEAPESLSLSNQEVTENEGDLLVGLLSTEDPDAHDSHQFRLVNGRDDDDNEAFEIVDNQLLAREAFNFEEQSTYRIRLQVTDDGGLSKTNTFVVQVLDTNDAPQVDRPIADQRIRASGVWYFNVGFGTFTDEDAGDWLTFSASMADGSDLPDWIRFSRFFRAFVFKPSRRNVGTYELKVKVTDPSGASAEQIFTLEVARWGRRFGRMRNVSNNVNVSPNPSRTTTSVDATIFEGNAVDVSITDLSGEVLMQSRSSGEAQLQIDVSGLKEGIYLIVVTDGEKVAKKKLLVR